MAKVTGPCLSLRAFGTLGKALTYQRRGVNACVYPRTVPRYRRTLAQATQRDKFQGGASRWHTYSQAIRGAFDEKAKYKTLSGYNYYIGLYLETGAVLYVVGQGVVGRDFVG